MKTLAERLHFMRGRIVTDDVTIDRGQLVDLLRDAEKYVKAVEAWVQSMPHNRPEKKS